MAATTTAGRMRFRGKGDFRTVLAERVEPVVAAAIVLGLGTAGVGFVVMHDANHGGYSTSRRVNALAAHSLDLIGGSSYLWRAKHLAHHTFTNVGRARSR